MRKYWVDLQFRCQFGNSSERVPEGANSLNIYITHLVRSAPTSMNSIKDRLFMFLTTQKVSHLIKTL